MPNFNGDTLIMTLDAPTNGALSQDVQQDWYKQWKLWALDGNLRYPPAFDDNFGGNTLTSAIDAGAYFVFQNNRGWRIRPYEASHTVYVAGNLAPADSSLPVTIPTVGAYTVMFAGLQPVTQNVDKILLEAQASSAAISESTESTQYLIEGLRPHHTGTGEVYYWDPILGSNANDGRTPGAACETFTHIHDNLVTDWNHDIVVAIDNASPGPSITTENIVISKNYVFLRGPGQGFVLDASNDGVSAVSITGMGVEVSKVVISTSATSTQPSVNITGDFALLENIWVHDAVDGIHVAGGEYTTLKNVKCHHNLGYGVKVSGTSTHVDIDGCHIGSNGSHGLWIDATGGHEVNVLNKTVIHGNAGWGVKIDVGSLGTIIHSDVLNFGNTLGNLLDSSTNTYQADAATDVRAELAAEMVALLEVWRRLGLDITAPLTQTASAITAGTIDLAITGDPETSVTVTRQP